MTWPSLQNDFADPGEPPAEESPEGRILEETHHMLSEHHMLMFIRPVMLEVSEPGPASVGTKGMTQAEAGDTDG